MNLGSHRSLGAGEGGRHFGRCQAGDVAKDDRDPVAERQRGEASPQLLLLLPSEGGLGWACRRIGIDGLGSRRVGLVLAGSVRVERRIGPAAAGNPNEAASCSAPTTPSQVDGDRRQPGSEGEGFDALAVVAGEGPVGAQEGVLGDLFGVPLVGEEPAGDGEDEVGFGSDEVLEGGVEVLGEGRREVGSRWSRSHLGRGRLAGRGLADWFGGAGRLSGTRGGGPDCGLPWIFLSSMHYSMKHRRARSRCRSPFVPSTGSPVAPSPNPRRHLIDATSARHPCDNAAVAHEDQFDDLLASLIGFYRTWIVTLGLELGLFEALRAAGDAGLDADALASAVGASLPHVRAWLTAADAHDLVEFDGRRASLREPTAVVLLDEDRPEYLGGQFVHATLASLDWDRLAEVFRTGTPVSERPDRYRASIERLTLQDVAVFFEEALAALPELVVELQRGIEVADLHCGGARWLIAIARRFPATTLVGVEAQPDSAARARRNVVAAGLADRITIEEAEVATIARRESAFGLVYFQYALHELADPVGALRAGWEALAAGGWLVVLDWCEPSTPDEYRTLHGQLVAGIQLDQLLMGTRLRTVEEFLGFFRAAGLPPPEVIDLPSGATLVVGRKPGA